MTLPDNDACFVNKGTVRNSTKLPTFNRFLIFTNVKVINTCPSIFCNMFTQFFQVLINAKTNYSNIFPLRVSLILGYHFLVVGHRMLARWAPRCPKVKQYDLSLFVRDCLQGLAFQLQKSDHLPHLLSNFFFQNGNGN